ncbi:glutathione transferase [Sarocladium strictum]
MAGENAQITLHWLEKSRADRVVWLLEELKVDYDVKLYRRTSEYLAPKELQDVHVLGKSPVVSVTPPGANAKPIVLAESAFISSYLCDHFPEGKRLVPKKWKDGMEGKFGGETEEWLRYEYLMHYTEGSLMPPLVMTLVFLKMKAGAPFFVRPLVNIIADRVLGSFVIPTLKKHLTFLEDQLSTSAGDYLCGANLTAADILISYGVMAFDPRVDELTTFEGGGTWRETFPKTATYVDRLKNEEGFKKSKQRIKEIEANDEAKL